MPDPNVKQVFQDQIQQMNAEISTALRKTSDRLFASGGVDPDSYEGGYWLPRIILRIALEEQAEQVMPRKYLEGRKLRDYRNLKHF